MRMEPNTISWVDLNSRRSSSTATMTVAPITEPRIEPMPPTTIIDFWMIIWKRSNPSGEM